jgi:DNA polymerase-3 subunit beta
MVSLYVTDKHVLFDLGDSTVVSRTIEGDFIKYDQIFSNDYNTVIRLNRKNIIMCLERASLLSRENKKNPIKVEIKNEKLIITSNTELGTAYEEMEIDMDGAEMNIAFNPKYLIDCLKVIEDDEISMFFTSTLSPCIIKPINGDDYKYLVLPVRINM